MKRDTTNTLKASAGVVVLLVIVLIAGAAGIATVTTIFSPDRQTPLRRYASGDGNDVRVTLRGQKVQFAFPDSPTSSREDVKLLTRVINSPRLIAPVKKEAVELVWFRLPPDMEGNDNLLTNLGAFEASNLRGKVNDATLLDDAAPAAYQFRVPAPKDQYGDYYVRIFVDNGLVFMLRVRAKGDGFKVLSYFADSYCIVGKDCPETAPTTIG